MLPNNNLQILRVSKADEGVYRCEARVEARGENRLQGHRGAGQR